MGPDVLAVIFVTVFLISCTNVNVGAEKEFTQAEYDIINDTASFPWQDLRNEIHQGDAITYELGTPQYQILNADEPIEIITPDQPGYYESLKRYEAAAMQQTEEKQSDTTTTPPEEIKKQTVTEKQEKRISGGEKKIQFIILNSQKKRKNPKTYLSSPNQYQQDVTKVETSKKNNEMNNKKPVAKETVPWTQKFNDNMEAHSKRNEVELVDLSKNIEKSKQIQSVSSQSNDKEEIIKPLEENTFIPNTETIIIDDNNNSSSTVLSPKILTESSLTEVVPATDIPVETPLQLPDTFLTYDTPPTEETSAPLNQKLKEPYMTEMSSDAPVYEAPPHIRDFEYLYRSALGLP
ncbi:formin-E [Bactrocera dorsalis]|uniref:Formin-E n=1 Tax=Bactrocera dorsalis TaxID=27457 RepID=A0A6I9UNZ7_BACDO|nr:formin-E [Bactrocera dorsalis]